jgi:hypothetical protein
MKEKREFEVVFHNLGPRSWIECTLCWNCPREDDKGCCYYNPTYYPLDFVYLLDSNPRLIDAIFGLPRVTVLEKYVGIDRVDDRDGDMLCQLHSRQGGCQLAADLRESVCRVYLCPGCRIWEEAGADLWKEFFNRLDAVEQEINRHLSEVLGERGLNFKTDRREFIREAAEIYREKWSGSFDWCEGYPREQRYKLVREVDWGKDWKI